MKEQQNFVHGPLQPWEASQKDRELIERLLASTDPRDNAYGEAYANGYFVVEFGGATPEKCSAAVGEMDRLSEFEFRLGREINPSELSMMDCINLHALPGHGATPAESVLDAMSTLQEYLAKNPDDLSLYGSFEENGYRVEAYMPSSSKQPRQWTVRVFSLVEESEEPIRTDVIPMLYEPIFGADGSDVAALEDHVSTLMQQLAQ